MLTYSGAVCRRAVVVRKVGGQVSGRGFRGSTRRGSKNFLCDISSQVSARHYCTAVCNFNKRCSLASAPLLGAGGSFDGIVCICVCVGSSITSKGPSRVVCQLHPRHAACAPANNIDHAQRWPLASGCPHRLAGQQTRLTAYGRSPLLSLLPTLHCALHRVAGRRPESLPSYVGVSYSKAVHMSL